MHSQIQFVVSTGQPNTATRKANQKLIRSHVTTRRYHEKRQKDIKDHLSHNEPTKTVTSPFKDIREPRVIYDRSTRHETDLNDESESSTQTELVELTVPSNGLGTLVHSSPTARTSYSDPDERTKSMIESLPPPSPYSYVGNGTSDPFISIPPLPSPRMNEHIFYCTSFCNPNR
jgi:hypothetical protein